MKKESNIFGEKVAIIYRTKNYLMFKFLHGNRDVDEAHVEKIKSSIKKIGYILHPIAVNEQFQIIDGQHRFCALRDLNMPIDYYITKDATIDQCVELNQINKRWKIADFVKSYADRGDLNFSYLQALKSSFDNLPDTVVMDVALRASLGRKAGARLRKGVLEFSEEEYNKAMAELTYVQRFTPIFIERKCKKAAFYKAVCFCYEIDKVDNERLYESVFKHRAKLIPTSDIATVLSMFQDVYNFNRLRKNVTFFVDDYKDYVARRMAEGRQRYKERNREKNGNV